VLVLAVNLASLRPDPELTPGLVAETDAAVVCQPRYAAAHRDVSDTTKRAIYAAYGVTPAGRWLTSSAGARYYQSDNEVDHRVSVELGGSNDPRNLWVQSYLRKTWNAWWKDALENRLHWLVCTGKTLPLADAQAALLGDWTVAYQRFILDAPPAPKRAP
jgi:hypothetical protein